MNLLTSIRRAYPGDSYRMSMLNTGGERCHVLFQRLDAFTDHLHERKRFRIVVPSKSVMYAAVDEAEVINCLLELGVEQTTIDDSITKLAVETAMLVHMKNDALENHLGEPYNQQGLVRFRNLSAQFKEVSKDKESLAAWFANLVTDGTVKPKLEVVEDTNETGV